MLFVLVQNWLKPVLVTCVTKVEEDGSKKYQMHHILRVSHVKTDPVGKIKRIEINDSIEGERV